MDSLSRTVIIQLDGITVLDATIRVNDVGSMLQGDSQFLATFRSLQNMRPRRPPTDDERILLRQFQSECLASIVSLEMQQEACKADLIALCRRLASLRFTREAKVKQVESCKDLLSLIHTLPPELLEEIFRRCLPRGPYNPSSRHAPLQLGQVCSSWRSFILQTPSLWSKLFLTPHDSEIRTLEFVQMALSTWNSNLRDHPLDIHFHLFSNSSMFSILHNCDNSVLKNIRHLGICPSSFGDDQTFHTIYLPSLQSIAIQTRLPNNIEYISRSLSLLDRPVSTITLDLPPRSWPGILEGNSWILWSRLSELHIEATANTPIPLSSFHLLLRLSRNLESVVATIHVWPEDAHTISTHPRTTLKHLDSLSVDIWGECRLCLLFADFAFPALNSFKIFATHSQCVWDCPQSLCDMVGLQQLCHLNLSGTSIEVGQLFQLLDTFNRLHSLHLDVRYGELDILDVLRHLGHGHSPRAVGQQPPIVAPSLEHFSFVVRSLNSGRCLAIFRTLGLLAAKRREVGGSSICFVFYITEEVWTVPDSDSTIRAALEELHAVSPTAKVRVDNVHRGFRLGWDRLRIFSIDHDV